MQKPLSNKQPTAMRLAFSRAISTKEGRESLLYGLVLKNLKAKRGLITRKKFWAVIR